MHEDAKSAELFRFGYVLEIEEAVHARRTSKRAAQQEFYGVQGFSHSRFGGPVEKTPVTARQALRLVCRTPTAAL
jgi:hypothetical protein